MHVSQRLLHELVKAAAALLNFNVHVLSCRARLNEAAISTRLKVQREGERALNTVSSRLSNSELSMDHALVLATQRCVKLVRTFTALL